MADKYGRERVSLYFNVNDPKELALWEFICSKYSKSAIIKEALEEKMMREKNGVAINLNTQENDENSADKVNIKEEKLNKETVKKAIKSGMIDL